MGMSHETHFLQCFLNPMGDDDDMLLQRERQLLSHLLDCLGVGVRALQEPAVPPKHLRKSVTRQAEEALSSVHDGVVGEGGVGDDEVLLGGLEGLDEGEVGVVKDLVGRGGIFGDQGHGATPLRHAEGARAWAGGC